MKIISGTLKGRNITTFDIDGTRPTMDRVRESLFGMIQNHIKGSVCLDLFCGTGILGLEAISNGCKYCYFNDSNKTCTDSLKESIKKFNITNCEVINKDYLDFLKSTNTKFDIVFLDPPYKEHIINDIITYLINNNMLNKGSLIICEVDNKYLDTFENLELYKERKYGDKFIIIFKNN